MRRSVIMVMGLLAAGAAGLAACGGSEAAAPAGSGRLRVLLTDAPFSLDSIASADLFVVRVDARREDADSAESASEADHPEHGGWTTVATPNASIDVLALRDGETSLLGEATLAAGTYRAFRLILDVDRSSITLKDGTTLTGASSPGIKFPSAGRSGLKVELREPVEVKGDPSALLIDFDLANSFVLRGNSLAKQGLLFKPAITAKPM
jgi:hypothetical protein